MFRVLPLAVRPLPSVCPADSDDYRIADFFCRNSCKWQPVDCKWQAACRNTYVVSLYNVYTPCCTSQCVSGIPAYRRRRVMSIHGLAMVVKRLLLFPPPPQPLQGILILPGSTSYQVNQTSLGKINEIYLSGNKISEVRMRKCARRRCGINGSCTVLSAPKTSRERRFFQFHSRPSVEP